MKSGVATGFMALALFPSAPALGQLCSCGRPCDVVLDYHNIYGVENHEACLSVVVGPDLRIEEGAVVTLTAGDRIIMHNGFSVTDGAQLVLTIDPALFCDVLIDSDDDSFDACLDCDDDDAEVNPDAKEVCNGVDDDCDDALDEDDPCDDDDACTLDSCQGFSGCSNIPDPGISCLPNAVCNPATGDCLCDGVVCPATGTNCCVEDGPGFSCDPDPCSPNLCEAVLLMCVHDCSKPDGFRCEDACLGIICEERNPDCDPRTGSCLCGPAPNGVVCTPSQWCCSETCTPVACEPADCTTPPNTACDPCSGCYDPGG